MAYAIIYGISKVLVIYDLVKTYFDKNGYDFESDDDDDEGDDEDDWDDEDDDDW